MRISSGYNCCAKARHSQAKRNTDALGSLSYALNVSAATLALGAILAAFQGKLGAKSSAT